MQPLLLCPSLPSLHDAQNVYSTAFATDADVSSSTWSGVPRTTGNNSAFAPTETVLKLAPARGVFPASCKWRAARDPGEKGRALWAVERYQYFDEATDAWSEQQPAACFVRGQPKPPECVMIHNNLCECFATGLALGWRSNHHVQHPLLPAARLHVDRVCVSRRCSAQ